MKPREIFLVLATACVTIPGSIFLGQNPQATPPALAPTRYGPEDLAEWRKGWENARRKTPLGYFGDPASANPERGGQAHAVATARTAEAITRHFESLPWSK